MHKIMNILVKIQLFWNIPYMHSLVVLKSISIFAYIKRIKPGEAVRFLGIGLDTQLSFTDYHNIITKRLNLALFAMRKVRNILSPETMKLLYYSFFTPI